MCEVMKIDESFTIDVMEATEEYNTEDEDCVIVKIESKEEADSIISTIEKIKTENYFCDKDIKTELVNEETFFDKDIHHIDYLSVSIKKEEDNNQNYDSQVCKPELTWDSLEHDKNNVAKSEPDSGIEIADKIKVEKDVEDNILSSVSSRNNNNNHIPRYVSPNTILDNDSSNNTSIPKNSTPLRVPTAKPECTNRTSSLTKKHIRRKNIDSSVIFQESSNLETTRSNLFQTEKKSGCAINNVNTVNNQSVITNNLPVENNLAVISSEILEAVKARKKIILIIPTGNCIPQSSVQADLHTQRLENNQKSNLNTQTIQDQLKCLFKESDPSKQEEIGKNLMKLLDKGQAENGTIKLEGGPKEGEIRDKNGLKNVVKGSEEAKKIEKVGEEKETKRSTFQIPYLKVRTDLIKDQNSNSVSSVNVTRAEENEKSDSTLNSTHTISSRVTSPYERKQIRKNPPASANINLKGVTPSESSNPETASKVSRKSAELSQILDLSKKSNETVVQSSRIKDVSSLVGPPIYYARPAEEVLVSKIDKNLIRRNSSCSSSSEFQSQPFLKTYSKRTNSLSEKRKKFKELLSRPSGVSVKEIAAVVDISINSSKSELLRKSYIELRDTLKKHYPEMYEMTRLLIEQQLSSLSKTSNGNSKKTHKAPSMTDGATETLNFDDIRKNETFFKDAQSSKENSEFISFASNHTAPVHGLNWSSQACRNLGLKNTFCRPNGSNVQSNTEIEDLNILNMLKKSLCEPNFDSTAKRNLSKDNPENTQRSSSTLGPIEQPAKDKSCSRTSDALQKTDRKLETSSKQSDLSTKTAQNLEKDQEFEYSKKLLSKSCTKNLLDNHRTKDVVNLSVTASHNTEKDQKLETSNNKVDSRLKLKSFTILRKNDDFHKKSLNSVDASQKSEKYQKEEASNKQTDPRLRQENKVPVKSSFTQQKNSDLSKRTSQNIEKDQKIEASNRRPDLQLLSNTSTNIARYNNFYMRPVDQTKNFQDTSTSISQTKDQKSEASNKQMDPRLSSLSSTNSQLRSPLDTQQKKDCVEFGKKTLLNEKDQKIEASSRVTDSVLGNNFYIRSLPDMEQEKQSSLSSAKTSHKIAGDQKVEDPRLILQTSTSNTKTSLDQQQKKDFVDFSPTQNTEKDQKMKTYSRQGDPRLMANSSTCSAKKVDLYRLSSYATYRNSRSTSQNSDKDQRLETCNKLKDPRLTLKSSVKHNSHMKVPPSILQKEDLVDVSRRTHNSEKDKKIEQCGKQADQRLTSAVAKNHVRSPPLGRPFQNVEIDQKLEAQISEKNQVKHYGRPADSQSNSCVAKNQMRSPPPRRPSQNTEKDQKSETQNSEKDKVEQADRQTDLRSNFSVAKTHMRSPPPRRPSHNTENDQKSKEQNSEKDHKVEHFGRQADSRSNSFVIKKYMKSPPPRRPSQNTEKDQKSEVQNNGKDHKLEQAGRQPGPRLSSFVAKNHLRSPPPRRPSRTTEKDQKSETQSSKKVDSVDLSSRQADPRLTSSHMRSPPYRRTSQSSEKDHKLEDRNNDKDQTVQQSGVAKINSHMRSSDLRRPSQNNEKDQKLDMSNKLADSRLTTKSSTCLPKNDNSHLRSSSAHQKQSLVDLSRSGSQKNEKDQKLHTSNKQADLRLVSRSSPSLCKSSIQMKLPDVHVDKNLVITIQNDKYQKLEEPAIKKPNLEITLQSDCHQKLEELPTKKADLKICPLASESGTSSEKSKPKRSSDFYVRSQKSSENLEVDNKYISSNQNQKIDCPNYISAKLQFRNAVYGQKRNSTEVNLQQDHPEIPQKKTKTEDTSFLKVTSDRSQSRTNQNDWQQIRKKGRLSKNTKLGNEKNRKVGAPRKGRSTNTENSNKKLGHEKTDVLKEAPQKLGLQEDSPKVAPSTLNSLVERIQATDVGKVIGLTTAPPTQTQVVGNDITSAVSVSPATAPSGINFADQRVQETVKTVFEFMSGMLNPDANPSSLPSLLGQMCANANQSGLRFLGKFNPEKNKKDET